MTDRELMEQALETAEGIVNADWRKWDELASPAEFERWAKSRANFMATALRERLAQPEQEPVACIGTNGELMWLRKPQAIYSKARPLYAAPPQRKPLTDEVIGLLTTDPRFSHIETPALAAFARVIERAHGIGEKE